MDVGFGDLLKRLRLDRGLTQDDLGRETGVSGAYISALETGKRAAPPHALVYSLARALDVDPVRLWKPAVEEREQRLRERALGAPAAQRRSFASADRETMLRDETDSESRRLVEHLLAAMHDEEKRQRLKEILRLLDESSGSEG